MISATAPLSLFHEIWTIDNQHETTWRIFLESAKLSHEYVTTTLAEHGVQLTFGQPDAPEKLDPPFVPTHPSHLLFSDNQITIGYPGNPITPHHLWISLNREVTDFTTVKPEETLMLHRAIMLVIKTLRGIGISDAVVAQWSRPQPGHPKNRYIVEVILTPPKSSKFLHVQEKVGSSYYVLYRGQFPHRAALPTQTEQKEALSFWKTSLEKPDFPEVPKKVSQEHPKDWTQTQKYLDKASEDLLAHSFQVLSKEVRISRKPTSVSPSREKELVTQKKGCAFCIDKVIKAQLVAETAFSYLLYNYKPANRHGHFLIVARRHVESITNLRVDEVKDIQEIATRLIHILGKTLVFYVQNGAAVGQTVPHFHAHALVPPSPLQYMLFGLSYNYSKPLKPEEVRSDADAMAKQFKQLTLTSQP